jgi:dihydrofolate synthase/folylpolyglutamate synthase
VNIADITSDLRSRQPESDMVPTLDRVNRVMRLLGEPQRSYRVIHVTGTNGKTSTARMIDGLMRAAGLRVGLYTSPHLHVVTERISIDGEPISEADFIAAYADVAPYLGMVDQEMEIDDSPRLTFFEVLTCLAYAAFSDSPVDVAVVEVGLGGSWDATNVADGDVAVITPISVDHANWLGDSPACIAGEKAGIIKDQAQAVFAGQAEDVAAVLLERCVEVGATFKMEGVDFSLGTVTQALGGQQIDIHGLRGKYPDVFLPIWGRHQAENALVAVAAAETFLPGSEPLSREIVDVLASVTAPGRLEVVARNPTVLVDAAHNPAGVDVLSQALTEAFSFDEVVGVVSISADKDVQGILRALRLVVSRVVFTTNSSDRAAPAAELVSIATALGVWEPQQIWAEPELSTAMELAVDLVAASENPAKIGLLATGSVVTAADVRAMFSAPAVSATARVATIEPQREAGLDLDSGPGFH